MKSLTWVSLLLRILLGGQLAYSGWAKATAFEWWRDIVVQMDLFPIGISGALAGSLPGVELVLGVTLILGMFQRASAILSAIVFLGFGGIMIHLVLKDAPAVCGCFGPGSEYPVDWNHVLIDFAWFCCASTLLFLPNHSLSLSR